MNSPIARGGRSNRPRPRCIAAGCALVLLAGCLQNGTSDNGNTNDNGAGGTVNVTGEIISFRSSFQLSQLEEPVSVLYSVTVSPTDTQGVTVVGYYQKFQSDAPDAPAVGDRVVVATDLTVGTQRAFTFSPETTEAGFIRVGVLVTAGGQQFLFESTGVVQIQGPPDPRFTRPCDPRFSIPGIVPETPCAGITEVVPGDEVIVSFDTRDPEGVVQWRLFVLAPGASLSAPPDELGTELQVGSGNINPPFTFSTAALQPGDYEIGVSATDTGQSISQTVDNGDLDRIVTIPREGLTADDRISGPIIRVVEQRIARPPTITFQAPGVENVALFEDQIYAVRFSVLVNEPGATALVDVFFDTDTNFENGNTPIAVNLPGTATSVDLDTTRFPGDGEYFVGISARDGINPRVVQYAQGRLEFARTGFLDVLTPDEDVSLRPAAAGAEGESVEITWETNVPTAVGLVDVFAQAVDQSGQASGAEIPILSPPTELTVTTAEFSSATSGQFEIFVRITFDDPDLVQLIRSAPGLVRVSSLPPVLWLGALDNATPPFPGAIFDGVNFEDNAGSAFTLVGDLNGDGIDEFVIAARYGKPFFINPSGIGSGEAYLIFGSSTRRTGRFNLNIVGTPMLAGVTLSGIRTPAGNQNTDGLSLVARIPDVDGDDLDELVFGFPNTESRGHNASPEQNGVVNPRSLNTLEKEGQFLRGGIVIVSSRNAALSSPDSDETVIQLDLVGQRFDSLCVAAEPGDSGAFSRDVHAAADAGDPCAGSCTTPSAGGQSDANESLDYGFVTALARDYFHTYVYSWDVFGGSTSCPSAQPFLDNDCLLRTDLAPYPALEFCATGITVCEPFSPGLYNTIVTTEESVPLTGLPGSPTVTLPVAARHSGFYNSTQDLEPLGARIIGVGLGDEFGTSLAHLASSGTEAGHLIVTSPARSARGLELGPEGGPEAGGEIAGLGTRTLANAGIGYLFQLRSLWQADAQSRIPPKPHQYIVGEASHCGGGRPRIDNVRAIRIAGLSGDRIRIISALGDFNDDTRDDFAIGAPEADNGRGRVYIAFRRPPAIEGDYVLEKFTLDPTDPERLDGLLLTTQGLDALGTSLASEVDFNQDGRPDVVIGSPTGAGGAGQVVIVFADPTLTSGQGGVSVQDLLTNFTGPDGAPRAVAITGNALDGNGLFGFNVANAGDVDGDGLIDLLIAAPNASPRHDPNPADGIDQLTAIGVDMNLDGFPDTSDDLTNAGLVYVILGSSRLDLVPPDPLTGEATIDIGQLGTDLLRGYIVAGRRGGDRIGGGDAGDLTQGGINGKAGRGRSFGLSSAGDVDGDGRDDILVGSVLADPQGRTNSGSAYLIYSTVNP